MVPRAHLSRIPVLLLLTATSVASVAVASTTTTSTSAAASSSGKPYTAACSSDYDCASLYCYASKCALSGTSGPKVGAPNHCQTDYNCGGAALCYGNGLPHSSDSYVCKTGGAKCSATAPCPTGSSCQSSGVCFPLKSAYDPCTSNGSCASGSCPSPALICAPESASSSSTTTTKAVSTTKALTTTAQTTTISTTSVKTSTSASPSSSSSGLPYTSACSSDYQCSSQYCYGSKCALGGSSGPKVGAPNHCQTDYNCGSAALCYGNGLIHSSDSFKCVARGNSCSSSANCASGQTCRSGYCYALKASYDPCVASTDCLSGSCSSPALLCAPASGSTTTLAPTSSSSTAKLTTTTTGVKSTSATGSTTTTASGIPATSGVSYLSGCTSDYQCASLYCLNLKCAGGGATGPKVGAPYHCQTDYNCGGAALCFGNGQPHASDSFTCVAGNRTSTGAACSTTALCPSGQRCSSGFCYALKPAYSPCTLDSDCLSGSCPSPALICSASTSSSSSTKSTTTSRSAVGLSTSTSKSTSTSIKPSTTTTSPRTTTQSTTTTTTVASTTVSQTTTTASPGPSVLPNAERIDTFKYTTGNCVNIFGASSRPAIFSGGDCGCTTSTENPSTYQVCPDGSTANFTACLEDDSYGPNGELLISPFCTSCTSEADCQVWTRTQYLTPAWCENSSQSLVAVKGSTCECIDINNPSSAGLTTSDFVNCSPAESSDNSCFMNRLTNGASDSSTASCSFTCTSGYVLSSNGAACVPPIPDIPTHYTAGPIIEVTSMASCNPPSGPTPGEVFYVYPTVAVGNQPAGCGCLLYPDPSVWQYGSCGTTIDSGQACYVERDLNGAFIGNGCQLCSVYDVNCQFQTRIATVQPSDCPAGTLLVTLPLEGGGCDCYTNNQLIEAAEAHLNPQVCPSNTFCRSILVEDSDSNQNYVATCISY